MSKITGRVLLTILVGYVFSYLFLFSYSLLIFTPREILPMFFWQWVSDNALILFLTTLIPVTSSALVLAYSLFLSKDDLTPGKTPRSAATFFTLLKSVMPVLLLFLGAYIFLSEAVLPGIFSRQQEMKYRTERAAVLHRDSQEAVDNGNLALARDSLQEYLELNPEDQKASELFDSIRKRLENEKREEKRPSSDWVPADDYSLMDASRLITEALAYLDGKDYYSAHYYASVADKLDPKRTEPERIMALAWEKISSPDTAARTGEMQRLFEKKREGYAALMKGDAITAYAVFASLKSIYPQDEDVAEYFRKSADELEKRSFFMDEIEKVPVLQGRREIFFRNPSAESGSEFIRFRKLAELRGEMYVQDVEAIAFDASGTVLYHLTAPFGKIIGRQVLLHAVDRNNPALQLQPVYHGGARTREFSNFLTIETDPENLYGLSTDRNVIRTLNLRQLYVLSSIYDRFGYRRDSAQSELLQRVSLYFNFLILAFLSIGMGWFLRSRYPVKMPAMMYLIIPALPFALYYLIRIFYYGQTVTVAFFLLTAGFVSGIIFLVCLEILLLFGALVFLSAQVLGNE